MHHPDALTTTSLTRLDHDRVTNLLGPLDSVLERLDARVLVRTVGNGEEALRRLDGVGDARAGPGHARDLGVLSDDGGGDLVAEGAHGGAGRTDEDNLVLGGRERLGEAWVLGCVSP